MIKVFEGFFDLIGGKPQTIISDEQASIEAALTELNRSGRWNGSHCFDVFHVIKNLSRRVRDRDQLSELKTLIYTKYGEVYDQELEKAKDRIRKP